MTITFLGTAAPNAYPEPFCQCSNCQQARVLGGPSIRKRAAALVNDDLLIDFGPDVLTAANLYQRPLTRVRYCLQTHPHSDHLDTSHFFSRSPGYGVVGAPRLHFYASAGTLRRVAKRLERDCAPDSFLDPHVGESLNVHLHPVEALQPFTVGPYQVTAFPANHDQEVEPLLYAIQQPGYTLFYGTDTDALPEETWQGFHRHRLRFDLVILDHTYGTLKTASDHMTAHKFIEHIARMRAEGLLAANARVLATHLAHDGNPPHPELVSFAARHNYEIAYDGLTV